MKSTLALLLHSVRRGRILIVAMAAVLGFVQVAFTLAAQTIYESGTFAGLNAMLPPFIRQAFGDTLAGFLSYSGLVAFGYFHPMIIAGLAALAVAMATEPVADIESRFLDLVLARPVRRNVVVARSALLVVLLPAVIIAVMVVATLVSLRRIAPPGAPVPSSGLVLTLAINLWAVVACSGAAALAVGAACRRRMTAAGIVGLALLVLFLTDYLSRIWKPAARVAPISPFHYFDAMRLVEGGPFPAGHVGILVAATCVGIALAFVIFWQRDV